VNLRFLASGLLGLALLGLSVSASAVSHGISVQANGALLGGLTFDDADVAEYDDVAGTAVLAFDESAFANDEDLDALHMFADGTFLFSTRDSATLGGLSFRDGDVALWDPVSGTASLYFDEDLFAAGENLDAVSVLGNGNLLLSTNGNASLAGLAFRDGDLVEYDPIGGIASLFFNEDLFTNDENIDAAHVLADGTLLISTLGNATLGGLSFRDGDVVRYDPLSGVATLYFSEDDFAGNENVDAYAVAPEPTSALLLSFGLAALAWTRRGTRLG